MSNETTLDDVLALVRSWRQEASDPAFPDDGDPCAREVLAEHDRTILRCADELEALLPELRAALEDARRYNKLKPMMTAANFYPEDPNGLDLGEGVALIFMLPVGTPVCSKLDSIIAAIDAAQEATP